MWRSYLAGVIGEDEARKFEVVEVARSGASGPKVVILKHTSTDVRYALKYGDTRVPISQQVTNRHVIAPLFGEHHLPQVFVSGDRMLLMSAVVGAFTFHEAVVGGIFDLDYTLDIFTKVMMRFMEVWKSTAVVNSGQPLTRDPLLRATRVKQIILSRGFDSVRLWESASRRVRVNGIELPSLANIMENMSRLYEPPKHVVTCHGDPNPDNFLVNSSRMWWLLDWEWVGTHDWRVMASHLIGWWLSNATYMNEQPKIYVDGEIQVEYGTGMSDIPNALIKAGWAMAEEMGVYFQEENWRQQLELQIAILLLGDLRFLEARGRTNHAIPLLGEGLKRLAALSAG